MRALAMKAAAKKEPSTATGTATEGKTADEAKVSSDGSSGGLLKKLDLAKLNTSAPETEQTKRENAGLTGASKFLKMIRRNPGSGDASPSSTPSTPAAGTTPTKASLQINAALNRMKMLTSPKFKGSPNASSGGGAEEKKGGDSASSTPTTSPGKNNAFKRAMAHLKSPNRKGGGGESAASPSATPNAAAAFPQGKSRSTTSPSPGGAALKAFKLGTLFGKKNDQAKTPKQSPGGNSGKPDSPTKGTTLARRECALSMVRWKADELKKQLEGTGSMSPTKKLGASGKLVTQLLHQGDAFSHESASKRMATWIHSMKQHTLLEPNSNVATGKASHCYALTVLMSNVVMDNIKKRTKSTNFKYAFNVSIYDEKNKKFIGRTYESDLKQGPGDNSSNVTFNELVYFHSSITDRQIFLVVEFVVYEIDPDNNRRFINVYGGGWSIIEAFKISSLTDTEFVAFDKATVISIPIYSGSPRALLYTSEAKWPEDLHPVKGLATHFHLQYHDRLLSVARYIPENFFFNNTDCIPGLAPLHRVPNDNHPLPCLSLRTKSQPVVSSLDETFTCHIEKLQITLPNNYENNLVRYIWQSECAKDKSLNTLEPRVSIVSRYLKLAVHNTYRFINATQDRSWTVVSMDPTEKNKLTSDNKIKLKGFIENPAVAILFELEYSLTIVKSITLPAEQVKLIAGFCAHVPVTYDDFIVTNSVLNISPLEYVLTTDPMLAFSDNLPYRPEMAGCESVGLIIVGCELDIPGIDLDKYEKRRLKKEKDKIARLKRYLANEEDDVPDVLPELGEVAEELSPLVLESIDQPPLSPSPVSSPSPGPETPLESPVKDPVVVEEPGIKEEEINKAVDMILNEVVNKEYRELVSIVCTEYYTPEMEAPVASSISRADRARLAKKGLTDLISGMKARSFISVDAELGDDRSLNDIGITLAYLECKTAIPISSLKVSFQLYNCKEVDSEMVGLYQIGSNGDDDSITDYEILPTEFTSNILIKAENTSYATFKFRVDTSVGNKLSGIRKFTSYCANKTLFVHLFHGDTLLPLGTVLIDPSLLLRQGEASTSFVNEYDVISSSTEALLSEKSTLYPHGVPPADVIGKVQVILSNNGRYKRDTKETGSDSAKVPMRTPLSYYNQNSHGVPPGAGGGPRMRVRAHKLAGKTGDQRGRDSVDCIGMNELQAAINRFHGISPSHIDMMKLFIFMHSEYERMTSSSLFSPSEVKAVEGDRALYSYEKTKKFDTSLLLKTDYATTGILKQDEFRILMITNSTYKYIGEIELEMGLMKARHMQGDSINYFEFAQYIDAATDTIKLFCQKIIRACTARNVSPRSFLRGKDPLVSVEAFQDDLCKLGFSFVMNLSSNSLDKHQLNFVRLQDDKKLEVEDRLRSIKELRETIKRDYVSNLLHTNIESAVTLRPSLGRVVWFEYRFTNPYLHEDRFIIKIPDQCLKVVTSTEEWRFLRDYLAPDFGEVAGALEDGLVYFPSGAPYPEILLAAGETVTIPFKFIHRGSDVEDLAAGNVSKNLSERIIPVSFNSVQQRHTVRVLKVSVAPENYIVDRYLFFAGNQNETLKRTLAVQTQSKHGGRKLWSSTYFALQSNEVYNEGEGIDGKYFHSSSKMCLVDVKQDSALSHSREGKTLSLKCAVGNLNWREEFLIFCYSDKYHLLLHEIWKVKVHSVLKSIMATCTVGDVLKKELVIPKEVNNINRRIHCVATHRAISLDPSSDFQLITGVNTEVRMTINPVSGGSIKDIVHVYDVDKNQLICSWAVDILVVQPKMVRIFDVKCTIGKAMKKKISFLNTTDRSTQINVYSDDHDGLVVRNKRIMQLPHQSSFIHLVLLAVSQPCEKQFSLFCNNESGENIETLKINVSYI